MTDVDTPAPPSVESLAAALAALVGQLTAAGVIEAPGPLVIPATGLVPNVNDGDLIEAAWGNAIRDRSGMWFDSLAALKAGWTAPPDGAHAYLLDEGSQLVAKGGSWRWSRKTFGAVVGSTAWLTWAALATAATSAAQLTINGRWCHLWVYAVLATPATASSGTLATIAAPYRAAAGTPRSDCAAVGATSTGGAAGRGYVDSGGIVGHQFTGAPANMTTILMTTDWATPDLVVA